MSVFRKLGTLSRARSREAAQVIVDRNAHRIMEQEITDIEQAIVQHKHMLAELIASKKHIVRELDAINGLIKQREEQAKRLMNTEDKSDLVDAIVSEITDHEMAIEHLSQTRDNTDKKIFKMEKILNKAVLEVSNYRRELRVVKATFSTGGSVRSATGLAQRFSELKDTHQNLIDVQGFSEDREEAWEEMESRVGYGHIDVRLEAVNGSDRQLRAAAVRKRLCIEG